MSNATTIDTTEQAANVCPKRPAFGLGSVVKRAGRRRLFVVVGCRWYRDGWRYELQATGGAWRNSSGSCVRECEIELASSQRVEFYGAIRSKHTRTVFERVYSALRPGLFPRDVALTEVLEGLQGQDPRAICR